MKEINKIFKVIIIGIISMGFFSCMMYKLVNYDSERFEEFKKGELKGELTDEFYCSRIITAVWLDLIIERYSRVNNFGEIVVSNICILDDKSEILYQLESAKFDSFITKNTDIKNNYYYKVYSYKIEDENLRIRFRDLKTKYLIINFEIDGKQYSDKLKKEVSRYPLLRT